MVAREAPEELQNGIVKKATSRKRFTVPLLLVLYVTGELAQLYSCIVIALFCHHWKQYALI